MDKAQREANEKRTKKNKKKTNKTQQRKKNTMSTSASTTQTSFPCQKGVNDDDCDSCFSLVKQQRWRELSSITDDHLVHGLVPLLRRVFVEASLGHYVSDAVFHTAFRLSFCVCSAEMEAWLHGRVGDVLKDCVEWARTEKLTPLQRVTMLSVQHYRRDLLHTVWVLEQVMRSLGLTKKLFPATLKARIFWLAYVRKPIDAVRGCFAIIGATAPLARWIAEQEPKDVGKWGADLIEDIAQRSGLPRYRELQPPEQPQFVIEGPEGKKYPVVEGAADHCLILGLMRQFCGSRCLVPMVQDDQRAIAAVVEYLNFHGRADPADEAAIAAWDAAYIDTEDYNFLMQRLLLANYLGCTRLLELASRSIAELVKAKTPDEVYAMFGVDDRLTPEEEAEIHADFPHLAGD